MKKREHKKWCQIKRKEHEEEEERKIRNISTEQEVWTYINKYKKRRENADEDIKEEEWRNHFMKQFGGSEKKRRLELKNVEDNEEKEKTSNIRKEELFKQLRKMKCGKAPGEDDLENEVWKYMPTSVGEALWEIIKDIWNTGELPQEWRKGVIRPIFKKGDKNDVNNYRGVTLMGTVY